MPRKSKTSNVTPLFPNMKTHCARLEIVLEDEPLTYGQMVVFDGIAPLSLVQQFAALVNLHNRHLRGVK